jgi:hypothetical protein
MGACMGLKLQLFLPASRYRLVKSLVACFLLLPSDEAFVEIRHAAVRIFLAAWHGTLIFGAVLPIFPRCLLLLLPLRRQVHDQRHTDVALMIYQVAKPTAATHARGVLVLFLRYFLRLMRCFISCVLLSILILARPIYARTPTAACVDELEGAEEGGMCDWEEEVVRRHTTYGPSSAKGSTLSSSVCGVAVLGLSLGGGACRVSFVGVVSGTEGEGFEAGGSGSCEAGTSGSWEAGRTSSWDGCASYPLYASA